MLQASGHSVFPKRKCRGEQEQTGSGKSGTPHRFKTMFGFDPGRQTVDQKNITMQIRVSQTFQLACH